MVDYPVIMLEATHFTLQLCFYMEKSKSYNTIIPQYLANFQIFEIAGIFPPKLHYSYCSLYIYSCELNTVATV